MENLTPITLELTGFTAALGVEKTLPLLNKASKRAKCSVHLSFINENCSAVTKLEED